MQRESYIPLDVDVQTRLSGSSEEETVHPLTWFNARRVAATVAFIVAGGCLVSVVKSTGGQGSNVVNASSQEIVSLAASEQVQQACTNAKESFQKIEDIIVARHARLVGGMPLSELETGKFINQRKYNDQLLEKIEAILDDAKWEDYIKAGVVITDEDMQAISRCLLKDPELDLSEEEEQPKQFSTAGANSQAGKPWPGGKVRYTFHSSCGTECKRAFRLAKEAIEFQVPCVKFSRGSRGNYIYVRSDKRGCWAELGQRGGKQELNLARGCQDKGTAIHEIFHALGMHHEQTRSDRDSYVTIHWENILSGKGHNFEKSSGGGWGSRRRSTYTGSDYDFLSIMHYGPHAFGKSGRVTIDPKTWRAKRYMGNRVLASQLDIEHVCKFYGCASSCNPQAKNADLAKQLSKPHGHGGCFNNDRGAEDKYGDGCEWYTSARRGSCGIYDDSDFTASTMCCNCGGGSGGRRRRRR